MLLNNLIFPLPTTASGGVQVLFHLGLRQQPPKCSRMSSPLPPSWTTTTLHQCITCPQQCDRGFPLARRPP